MTSSPLTSVGERAKWQAILAVGVVGASASLTMLFLGMRSVMDIGGSCASGGPYVTARPCPAGVGWAIPASIWVGIGCVCIASVAALRLGWPSIAWLGWPALFLSLGWNFWEYGLDPPGGDGIVWSWIVCGALFVAMGAGPVVLWLANPQDRPSTTRAGRAARGAARAGVAVRQATTPPPFRPTPAPGEADDLVGSLERLAHLHEAGRINDDEYAAAKRALLGDRRER